LLRLAAVADNGEMSNEAQQATRPESKTRWGWWAFWGVFLILSGAGNIHYGIETTSFPPVTWWNFLQVGIGDIIVGGVGEIIAGIALVAVVIVKRRRSLAA
jgi:hypothetical protein